MAGTVHLTNICHLWIVATLWEWCSCIDIGYLCVSHQLSVNVASDINCHCHNDTNVRAFPWHIHETECFTPHSCWVFGTSGMWDRVARLAVPDVSQDCSVFIFKIAYSNKTSSFTLWPFEDEGTKIRCNVSNHKPNITAPNPRIRECSVSQLFTCLHMLLPLSNTPVVGVRPHRYRYCALTATSAIVSHSSASVLLSYFLFDEWDCHLYWWVFAFCSMLPAIVDAVVAIGVLVLRKGWM